MIKCYANCAQECAGCVEMRLIEGPGLVFGHSCLHEKVQSNVGGQEGRQSEIMKLAPNKANSGWAAPAQSCLID